MKTEFEKAEVAAWEGYNNAVAAARAELMNALAAAARATRQKMVGAQEETVKPETDVEEISSDRLVITGVYLTRYHSAMGGPERIVAQVPLADEDMVEAMVSRWNSDTGGSVTTAEVLQRRGRGR